MKVKNMKKLIIQKSFQTGNMRLPITTGNYIEKAAKAYKLSNSEIQKQLLNFCAENNVLKLK